MAERLKNHDVVIGPALRDLASVRHFYNGRTESWEKKSDGNAKNDFEKLSIKFKELRSLAINYKEEKEKEIEKLKKQLNEFKTAIEKRKSSYEKILDKTTK